MWQGAGRGRTSPHSFGCIEISNYVQNDTPFNANTHHAKSGRSRKSLRLCPQTILTDLNTAGQNEVKLLFVDKHTLTSVFFRS